MYFAHYSAYKLGIPFIAVPTIVSSDGFTADICSIIIDGQKKSILMQAADAVICDMDIVSGAPMFLTIAGVQDILAKYVSIADRKIAHIVSGKNEISAVTGADSSPVTVFQVHFSSTHENI